MKKVAKLKRFGVSMEEELLERFDRYIEKAGYKTRSEAIRDLIRDKLVEEKFKEGKKEMIGILGIVYEHEIREVEENLVSFEHKIYKRIISTIHVHLDEHTCLEVKILKGKPSELKKIKDKIISTRGVKHGGLLITGDKEVI